MVDKLIGPIKFVKCELHKDDLHEMHLVNQIKYLFAVNRININNVKDWPLKREIQFEFRVGEKIRRIKIKGYKSNFKAD